jgi:hypothetical protein
MHASPDIIKVTKSRRMIKVRHVAHMGEMRNAYIFIGESERKRPSRRHRHRKEDKIRMDLREIGWKSVNWMHVAQDRDKWWALVTW